MRVSPSAWLAISRDDCLEKAEQVTAITHNHPEGIKGALATAHAIWLALQDYSANEIRTEIADAYDYDLSPNVEQARAAHQYNETAQGCVPEALICALESTSYEDAVRNAVSPGGDADTLAAIAGSR